MPGLFFEVESCKFLHLAYTCLEPQSPPPKYLGHTTFHIPCIISRSLDLSDSTSSTLLSFIALPEAFCFLILIDNNILSVLYLVLCPQFFNK
jgi:hypothetical protein